MLLKDPTLISTNDNETIEKTYNTYMKHCKGKKFIAFARSVAHSQMICKYFNEHGVSTLHIDAHTPDLLRQRIFDDFRNGKITGICSVGVLCEGFDEPSAEVCIMARPTLSRSLYFQQVGRVLRIAPNKDSAYLIDVAGNVWQHGYPTQTIEISADDVIPIDTEALNVVVCPVCGYVQETHDTKRPGFCIQCGASLAEAKLPNTERRGRRKKVLVQEELVQVDDFSGITVDLSLKSDYKKMISNLISVCNTRDYKKRWIIYQLKRIYGNIPPHVAEELCKQLGYKIGWFNFARV